MSADRGDGEMRTILGCPICGDLPGVETPDRTVDHLAFVHCAKVEDKHTVEVSGFTTAEAIARWNWLPRFQKKLKRGRP